MDDSEKISHGKKQSILKHIKELHSQNKKRKAIAKSVFKKYNVKLID